MYIYFLRFPFELTLNNNIFTIIYTYTYSIVTPSKYRKSNPYVCKK